MVFLVSGPKHEAHIGFHDAVAKAFLHEALDVRRQTEDDPLITFTLPKDARDFGIRLKRAVSAESDSPEDIAAAFPEGLTYVSTRLDGYQWSDSLTEEYLRYWQALPDLGPNRTVCVGISIEAERTKISRDMLLERFPTHWFEKRLHFEVMDDLRLPATADDAFEAAVQWVREPKVRSAFPRLGSELAHNVRDIFKPDMPMEDLAKYLVNRLQTST
jgi:hypothetical protein